MLQEALYREHFTCLKQNAAGIPGARVIQAQRREGVLGLSLIGRGAVSLQTLFLAPWHPAGGLASVCSETGHDSSSIATRVLWQEKYNQIQ